MISILAEENVYVCVCVCVPHQVTANDSSSPREVMLKGWVAPRHPVLSEPELILVGVTKTWET